MRAILILVAVGVAAAKPSGSEPQNGGAARSVLACGSHTLTAGLYSIKSPNHPSNYGNNYDCTYNITPGVGVDTMTLECCAFDLENNSYCSWDWLKVNGVKFCGSTAPVCTVNGNLNIEFHSDYSVVKPGFHCQISVSG